MPHFVVHTHVDTHTLTHTHTHSIILSLLEMWPLVTHTHTHTHTHVDRQTDTNIALHFHCSRCRPLSLTHTLTHTRTYAHTGWRRLKGSPKLQIIFHKRATKYRSILRKMAYKNKGSYESSPPCGIVLSLFQTSHVVKYQQFDTQTHITNMKNHVTYKDESCHREMCSSL